MAENNAKKSISVSTVVIIILAVVIVLMLIFGTVIFFMMKSNKEENPATVANTNSQVVAENETKENNSVTNESTDTTSTTNTQPVASGNISDDWKDCEFILNNKAYKLYFPYSDLKNDGWTFDLADYGYANGYVMNPGNKVTGTINLENPNFDSTVRIGFINDSNSVKDITECNIWSFEVDNAFVDDDETPVSFTLPKGIHNGSSLQDVINAYGEPKDSYRADSLGYWNYTYQDEYSKYFRLTIYDDKVVTAFSYDMY